MTEPFPYQYNGAVQIQQWNGRALLADEMGLGKSIQALYWCMKRKHARPIIVVCPASLKFNWEREASHHVEMMSEVLEGRKPPRRKAFAQTPILIINYEILHYWVDYLRALKPQVVLIDECHYIKNRGSRRFKAVKSLVENVPHVIALSGTPLTNRPAELWPVLSLVRPDKFRSFIKYVFKWCKPRKTPWGWVYDGAKDLDVLHERLKRLCMIRRLKKDVLTELPPKVRHVVPCALTDRREYEEATYNFLKWLGKTSPHKVNKAKKSEALVQIGYLLRLCAKLKVPYVYDWIDNFLEASDDKLVVMTCHRKMIDLLHERYGKASVVVDGRVKGRDRQWAVDAFQHNPKVRLFLGNVRAAGVGLTLTASSTCVFTDLPWTPGDLVQGEDRIHRIGQKNVATIYYLVARHTIEEKLCRILQGKQDILSEVLDGGAAGDNLNVFDTLLKTIAKKGI